MENFWLQLIILIILLVWRIILKLAKLWITAWALIFPISYVLMCSLMRLIKFPTLENLPNLFFLMNTILPYREEDKQWEYQQKVPCSYLPQWKSVCRRGTEPRNLVIACLLGCHDNRQNPLITIPNYDEYTGLFLPYLFLKEGRGQLHLLKVTPSF